MGDAFVAAFAAELERTQRALPPSGLLCVPQPRSLLSGEPVTQEDLYAHFLTPVGLADGAGGRLGEYDTLNGRKASIEGAHVRTGAGFGDRRTVRILLSEHREVHKQRVAVLHLSRPLSGGLELPEDPNELDMATFRRLTAILRAFPENELVFYQLDQAVHEVKDICAREDSYRQYESDLPGMLRDEWEASVDELITAGSFDDEREAEDAGRGQRHDRHRRGGAGHLLQIQQVVECYLMEELHGVLFPRLVESCRDQDARLAHILFRMRHYTPADFGIRKEFQCYVAEARDVLLGVCEKKTPLDMLLVFKSCIDRISDAITRNVKLRRLDFERYQLTTDDILDQLLYVLVQVSNAILTKSATGDAPARPPFPISAVLRYISDFHFINSNTTALGFTIANFQVAVEFFLMKEPGKESVGAPRTSDSDTNLLSVQEIAATRCEQSVERNRRLRSQVEERVRAKSAELILAEPPPSLSDDDPSSDAAALVLIGEWSVDEDREADDETQEPANGPVPHRHVDYERAAGSASSKLTQVSAGRRFFAAVDQDGRVFTWGDSGGSRLGYAIPMGHSRRISRPQPVTALAKQRVVHVSCGAFHALATDINGHVFAWGSNSRGQLGFLGDAELQSTTAESPPRMLRDLCGVFMSAVACGEYHSLGLSADGDVYSWGSNRYGKLGRPTGRVLDAAHPRAIRSDWTGCCLDWSPIRSPRGAGVRRIAAGKDHSVAVTNDGAVFTWGRGDAGQLGHGCFMDVDEPKQVMALAPQTRSDASRRSVAEAAAGAEFSLFLAGNPGFAYICGRDPSLASGHELLLSPALVAVPPRLQDEGFGSNLAGISCGDTHYCLVTARGALAVSRYHLEQEEGGVADEEGGGTASEHEKRQLDVLREVGRVRSASAGGSHTLALVT